MDFLILNSDNDTFLYAVPTSNHNIPESLVAGRIDLPKSDFNNKYNKDRPKSLLMRFHDLGKEKPNKGIEERLKQRFFQALSEEMGNKNLLQKDLEDELDESIANLIQAVEDFTVLELDVYREMITPDKDKFKSDAKLMRKWKEQGEWIPGRIEYIPGPDVNLYLIKPKYGPLRIENKSILSSNGDVLSEPPHHFYERTDFGKAGRINLMRRALAFPTLWLELKESYTPLET